MQTPNITPASSGIELTRKGERYAAETFGGKTATVADLTPSVLYALAINHIRREAAAEIERLIRLLDDLGGDPDLEGSSDFEDSTDAEEDRADWGSGDDADASFCDAWEGRP